MKEAVLVGAPAGPCRGTHQSLSGADPPLFYGATASPRALGLLRIRMQAALLEQYCHLLHAPHVRPPRL